MHIATVISNAVVTCVLFVGTGYAVFGLGHSPWWFTAALVVDLAVSQRSTSGPVKESAQ